jgi:hypothetical protein
MTHDLGLEIAYEALTAYLNLPAANLDCKPVP